MRELLVFTLDGQQYGIWKDDVLSVRDVSLLHRIPLSPACIAGMSIIDDRTVTLADLSVCIGHSPASGKEKGRILLMPGREKVTGFVVHGELSSLSVSPDDLSPIPFYLATPLVDTCAVHAGAPIPLINIATLHQRVMTTDQEPPMASLEAAGARPGDVAAIDRIRLFVLGGELFASDGAGMAERAIKPGPTSGLTLLPRYVRGMTFYDGQILPVIDLAQRIKRQAASLDPWMLLSEINGARFGLLVDEDRGAMAADAMTIKTLPPLARTPWCRAAATVSEGAITPLLDLPPLLTLHSEEDMDKPHPQRYAPDSRFADLFSRGDVEVVEFALLGVRHALPKSEVEDVVDFKACREIPGVPEIVIGVAEYEGELRPVLDLAMVFGRRSPARPGWRMIAVKNGDFRALVVTETVYGERRLAQDVQRAVPILLPHRVVYGCYPDVDAVRLILNVEAMAVYFEKALVRELLPALSREMQEAPAEIVASLLGEESVSIAGPRETAIPVPFVPPLPLQVPVAAAFTQVTAGESPVATHADTEKGTIGEQVPGREAIAVEVRQQEPAAAVVSEPQASEDRDRHSQNQAAVEALSPAIEEEQKTSEGVEDSHPVIQEEVVKTEKEEALHGELVEAGTVPAEEGMVDEAPSAQQPTEEQPGEDTVSRETAPAAERAVGEAEFLYEEGKTAAAATDELPTPQQGFAETIPAIEQAGVSESGYAGAEKIVEEKTTEERIETPWQEAAQLPRDEEEVSARLSPKYDDARQPWKRRLAYAALGAALIALFYMFAGIPQRSGEEKPAKEAVPEKSDILSVEKPQPAKEHRPSLVLDVPADRPAAVDVYLVVEGDTLWDISERFTGNPFNYPHIAGENRIADPDLIFPGQKIRLKQKSQAGQ